MHPPKGCNLRIDQEGRYHRVYPGRRLKDTVRIERKITEGWMSHQIRNVPLARIRHPLRKLLRLWVEPKERKIVAVKNRNIERWNNGILLSLLEKDFMDYMKCGEENHRVNGNQHEWKQLLMGSQKDLSSYSGIIKRWAESKTKFSSWW